jgi:UDPglucose 6-dehydrogenase
MFWEVDVLKRELSTLADARVAILGLTYKPGTDTLRRSRSLMVAERLMREGAAVFAYDPAARELPPEWDEVGLCENATLACKNAEAALVITPWPEFENLNWKAILSAMARPLVLDCNRAVSRIVPALEDAEYFTVGQPAP